MYVDVLKRDAFLSILSFSLNNSGVMKSYLRMFLLLGKQIVCVDLNIHFVSAVFLFCSFYSMLYKPQLCCISTCKTFAPLLILAGYPLGGMHQCV